MPEGLSQKKNKGSAIVSITPPRIPVAKPSSGQSPEPENVMNGMKDQLQYQNPVAHGRRRAGRKRPRAPRPLAVRLAIGVFVATALLSVGTAGLAVYIHSAVINPRGGPPSALLTFWIVTFGIYIWLLNRIAQARGWARGVLGIILILTAAGFIHHLDVHGTAESLYIVSGFLPITLIGVYLDPPWLVPALVSSLFGLQATALGLTLIPESARAWYRAGVTTDVQPG